MNLAQKAFTELYPDKTSTRKISIKYSARFKDYNANVRYSSKEIIFKLSKKWQTVSEEIQIGLIQNLLLRVFKSKGSTLSTSLYESFIKNVSKYSFPTKFEPDLKDSFNRMNEQYFNNFLEKPNLIWGWGSFRKLGSYEYATDTITISTVLKDDPLLQDYVMYHEMLHKDIKFETKNGRNFHHTPEFRRREKLFHDKDAENKLQKFLRNKKLKRTFRFF